MRKINNAYLCALKFQIGIYNFVAQALNIARVNMKCPVWELTYLYDAYFCEIKQMCVHGGNRRSNIDFRYTILDTCTAIASSRSVSLLYLFIHLPLTFPATLFRFVRPSLRLHFNRINTRLHCFSVANQNWRHVSLAMKRARDWSTLPCNVFRSFYFCRILTKMWDMLIELGVNIKIMKNSCICL